MTWNGILAAVGGLLFVLGLFGFIMAEIADGYTEDFDTKDPTLRRQFKYGLVYGVTGTLVFLGLLAAFVGVCGAHG